MKTVLVGVVGCFALFIPGAAAAADPQLMAPVHQFIDSFNKGDVKTAEAVHAAGGVAIIDEPPPHFWSGPGAFKAWAAALEADGKKRGDTDQKVTVSDPIREEVSGDHAYLVVPALFTFKEKGAAMQEQGQMTFALTKAAGGWKISGWTWSGPRPSPAT
jgi:ketosteroid isomerase-like protein